MLLTGAGAGGCGLVPAARWRGAGTAVLVDLEGHGREEIFADVDLSRTVGWFTSLFPVRLDPGGLDLDEALAGGPALGRALKPIKEQLRAVPDNGLGYGLLRYLNPQTAAQLARLCGAADWLQLSGAVCGGGGGGLGRGARGGERSAGRRSGDAACACARGQCAHARWGGWRDADARRWSWAPALLGEAAVRDLAQGWFAALEALVRHVAQPGAGGRTPSDLPLVALSQAEIERLESALSADRGHPAAVAAAGGAAVPCAV